MDSFLLLLGVLQTYVGISAQAVLEDTCWYRLDSFTLSLGRFVITTTTTTIQRNDWVNTPSKSGIAESV